MSLPCFESGTNHTNHPNQEYIHMLSILKNCNTTFKRDSVHEVWMDSESFDLDQVFSVSKEKKAAISDICIRLLQIGRVEASFSQIRSQSGAICLKTCIYVRFRWCVDPAVSPMAISYLAKSWKLSVGGLTAITVPLMWKPKRNYEWAAEICFIIELKDQAWRRSDVLS